MSPMPSQVDAAGSQVGETRQRKLRHVLIADDHELLRRGVQRVLEGAFEGVETVGAANGGELVERLHERRWDVILLDIVMPGNPVEQTLAEIRALDPLVPVIAVTGVTEGEHLARAMKAGANGIVHKDRASSDLVDAIRTVVNGGTFLQPETAELLEQIAREEVQALPHLTLSTREAEIFRMIALGLSVKDIAKSLEISEKTVMTYLTRIRAKTGLTSYVDIARYALRNGLVT